MINSSLEHKRRVHLVAIDYKRHSKDKKKKKIK